MASGRVQMYAGGSTGTGAAAAVKSSEIRFGFDAPGVGHVTKTVVLYGGMPIRELLAVVDAVFGGHTAHARVVGFETNGFLIPPSVLCAHPELYHQRELQLRVQPQSHSQSQSQLQPQPQSQSSAAKSTAAAATAPRAAAGAGASNGAPTPARAAAASAAAPTSAGAGAAAAVAAPVATAVRTNTPAVVRGPVVFRVTAGGETLDVYASDLETLIAARSIGLAARLDIEQLIEAFKDVNGQLHSVDVLRTRVFQRLLPSERHRPAVAFLTDVLTPVFRVFQQPSGAVAPGLVAGLTLLCCDAPRDDQLFVAFTLFTAAYEGLMSDTEQFRFWHALLSVLLAPFTSTDDRVMPSGRRLSPVELTSVATISATRAVQLCKAARAAADRAAADALGVARAASSDRKFTFPEFSQAVERTPELAQLVHAFDWLGLAFKMHTQTLNAKGSADQKRTAAAPNDDAEDDDEEDDDNDDDDDDEQDDDDDDGEADEESQPVAAPAAARTRVDAAAGPDAADDAEADEEEEDGAADEGDGDDDDDESSDDPVALVLTTSTGQRVAITADDLVTLRRIRATARLQHVALDKLVDLFARYRTTAPRAGRDSYGYLTRDGFARVMLDVIRASSSTGSSSGRSNSEPLTAQERSYLEFQLQHLLFDMFDADASGAVSLREFVVGMSVLAGGSVQDKLLMGFNLFDTDRDGFISRAELGQYLASYLRLMLMPAYAAAAQRHDSSLRARIQSFAYGLVPEAVDAVFRVADTDRDGRISFAEFLPFVTHHHHVLPWMSLLPILTEPAPVLSATNAAAAAGPAPAPAPARAAAPPAAVRPDRKSVGAGTDDNDNDDDDDDNDEDDDGDDEPVVAVRLTNAGHKLQLTSNDLSNLRWLKQQFRNLTPRKLQAAFAAYANPHDGTLSRDAFISCMLSVLDTPATTATGRGSSSSAQQRQQQRVTREMLVYQLSVMFAMFDLSNDGVVDWAELQAGVYVIGRGSHTEKMALIFNCFDTDGSGTISAMELVTFFASYLSTVFSVASTAQGMDHATIRDVVRRASHEAADKLLYAANRNRDGTIGFAEFVDVYDRYPSLVPWIGLLDDALDEQDDADEAAVRAEVAAEQRQRQQQQQQQQQLQAIATAAGAAAATAAARRGLPPSEIAAAAAAAAAAAGGPARPARPARPQPQPQQRASNAGPMVPDSDDDDDDDEEVESDDEEVVFSVPLTADRSIDLRQSDLDDLTLLQNTIGAAGTERLLEVFARFMNDDGRLDEARFTHACEYLVPPSSVPESKRLLMQFLLGSMFKLFDDDGNGVIDCKEFLAGAVSLTKVQKLDRLTISFMIVDVDGDGRLSRSEVINFVGAFLRVLLGVSAYAREQLSPQELQVLVQSAAELHTDELFRAADTDHDGTLSFDEFQAVCATNPRLVSWVSLMDRIGDHSHDAEYDAAHSPQRYASSRRRRGPAPGAGRQDDTPSKTQLKRRAKIAARRSRRAAYKADKAAARARAARDATRIPASNAAAVAAYDAKHGSGAARAAAAAAAATGRAFEPKSDRQPVFGARPGPLPAGASPRIAMVSRGAGMTGAVASTPRGGRVMVGSGGAVASSRAPLLPASTAAAAASSRQQPQPQPQQVQLTRTMSLHLKPHVAAGAALLRSSLFDRITTEQLLQVFSRHCRRDAPGVLDRAGFERAMRELVPRGGTLSLAEQHGLQFLLSQCFAAFDDNVSGDVDAHEFVAGLNMLCGAPGSDPNSRLAVSFLMIDANRDGHLSRAEFSDFIGAFLKVVIGLNHDDDDDERTVAQREAQQATIRAAVRETTAAFFAAADTDGDDLVSFPEFARLYRASPHLIPWLPVLNNLSPGLLTSNMEHANLARAAAHAAVARDAAHSARTHQLRAGVAAHAPLAHDAAALGRARLQVIREQFQPAPALRAKLATPERERQILEERQRKSGGEAKVSPALLTVRLPKGRADLTITQMDVSTFNFLRTAFAGVSPQHLMATFAAYASRADNADGADAKTADAAAPAGVLDRDGFLGAIQHLVESNPNAAQLSATHKHLLYYLLSRCHALFDRDGSGGVDYAEFMSAMQVLCSDALNARDRTLALGFMLADADGNGYLSRTEFCDFLSAFMRLVVALNMALSNLPARQLNALVERNAVHVTDECFRLADVNHDGRISFGEFTRIYATHPHLLPWLQVLDRLVAAKPAAPAAAPAAAGPAAAAPATAAEKPHNATPVTAGGASSSVRVTPALRALIKRQGSVDAAAIRALNGATGETPLLIIPLGDSHSDLLVLYASDLSNFSLLKQKLAHIDTPQLLSAFNASAADVGMKDKVNRDGFNKCIERLFATADAKTHSAAQPVTPTEQAAELNVRLLLNALYDVFDYDRDGLVSVAELVSGLTFVCTTTSVSHKLVLAFLAVDADKDGCISTVELHRFFVSLFSMLVAATHTRVPDLHLEQMHTRIARAAAKRTAEFFAAADTNRDGRVTCDEFMDVYKKQPELISWLKLFDFTDAPAAPSAGAPAAAAAAGAATASASAGTAAASAPARRADGPAPGSVRVIKAAAAAGNAVADAAAAGGGNDTVLEIQLLRIGEPTAAAASSSSAVAAPVAAAAAAPAPVPAAAPVYSASVLDGMILPAGEAETILKEAVPPPASAPASAAEADSVTVTSADLARLRTLRVNAGLNTISAQRLYDVFHAHATTKTGSGGADAIAALDRKSFSECLAVLIPGLKASAASQTPQAVEFTFGRLFDVFDSDRNGVVDRLEFAFGLSVFCSGTRTEKLGLAFDLFDADRDGLISRAELFVYLRALLGVLLSSTSVAQSTPAAQLAQVIAQQARAATERVFALADTNGDDKLSFAEFVALVDAEPALVPWLQVFDVVALADDAVAADDAASAAAAAAASAASAPASAAPVAMRAHL